MEVKGPPVEVLGRQDALPDDIDSVAAASSSIAVLTLLSRLSGFARGLVIAGVLGPTFFGNLFLVTNSLPNLLYEFAIGSLLVSLLVPPLVRHLDMGEPERTKRTANGTLGLLCLVFLAASALLLLAAPIVLRMLGAGIDDPAVLADQQRVGWPLLALVIPQAVLYAVVGTSAAVQNAHGRFALTAAAPIAENVGTILVFVAFAVRWGTGVDLETVTTAQVLFLGIGATLAVALHAAVQWWGAWRVGHRLVPTAGWRDPDVLAIVRLAVPSLGYAALNAGRYLVALMAAGSVRGGVVAYQLALNFRDLPNALVTRPLSVTSLPALSRLAYERQASAFTSLYRSTARLVSFLLAPASVLLVVLAVPIAATVTFGSMSSEVGRALLVAALATMTVGIVGDGVFQLATNAFYARRDARQPFSLMLLRTGLTAAGAVVALGLDGTGTLVVLGLSIAAADIVTGLLLHLRLEQSVRAPDRSHLLRHLGRVAACTAAAAAAGAIALTLSDPGADAARLAHLGRLALGSTAVLGAYVGAAALLRLPELGQLGTFLPRRAHSTTARPSAIRRVVKAASAAAVGLLALTAVTAVVGLGATVLDTLLPVGLIALGLVVAVYCRPAVAAYLWLGATPLIVGIDRGTVVPLLRLNEALLAVLIAGVLLRSLLVPRGRVDLRDADASVVALAIAGSIVPLVVLFSRAGGISTDEIFFVAPIVKLAIVYAVFRVVLRTPDELRTALKVGLTSASVAAVIGFLQTLGFPGVRSFLASNLYASGFEADASVAAGRGSSTLGSAIGAAGLYLGCLLLAIAWLRRPGAPRRFLWVIVAAMLVGLAGTAQFTALIGLPVGLVALRYIDARTPPFPTDRREGAQPPAGPRFGVARSPAVVLAIGTGAVLSAWIAFAPRISTLLEGELPQSWTERWHNLSTHFLSELGLNTNLVIGASPVTQVSDPRGFVEWIWIESGYVQLLYTGGLVLLAAYVWTLGTHLADAWSARDRSDEFGAAAAATWAMGMVLTVLMVIDPHLTIRGTGDLLFPLLAVTTTAAATRPAARAERHARPVPVLTLTPTS